MREAEWEVGRGRRKSKNIVKHCSGKGSCGRGRERVGVEKELEYRKIRGRGRAGVEPDGFLCGR